MSDPTTTTCARHPGTETRLHCSQCGTPICPRCSVETPVGQKCPDCARQKRTAVRQGRPRQYAKAAGAGVVVAAGAGFLLPLLWGIPLVGFFASFGAGLAVAEAVRWGAEGNQNPPFRNLAVGLALLSVAGGMYAIFGLPPFGGAFSLLSYLVAGWGAWSRY